MSTQSLSTTPTDWSGFRVAELAAATLLAAALGWAYAPTFAYLHQVWSEPNYSHGYFVIPIALAILWLRRDELDRARVAPAWWGWAFLVGVLGLRAYLFEQNLQWLEDATIPLAAAGLAMALGGWPLLRWSLPAIIFLGFMLPLPDRVNKLMAFRLQGLATSGSVALLQLTGLPVIAEGNVINMGANRLEVARACNGLSMLMSFVTLIAATVILVRRPIWERGVLLLSAIPIALVTNILRIVATALCYHYFGTEVGEKLAHDWAGYLMMPVALALVMVELRLMSWLIVEADEEQERPGVAFPGTTTIAYRTPEDKKRKVAEGGGPASPGPNAPPPDRDRP